MRRRVETAARGIHDSDDHERRDGRDERVSRCGEQRGGLADAAKVAEQQDGDYSEADRYHRRAERRDCRAHGVESRGGRDRHGQDVVGDQPGRGEQPRGLPEVLGGDDVRPTAMRIGTDRLPVRDADRHDHAGDRRADGQRPREPRSSSEHQHREDRLGTVGDRRQRIGREHGERHDLAHPLPHNCAAPDRRSEQHAAQPFSRVVGRCSLELLLRPAARPHVHEPPPPCRLGDLGHPVQRRIDRQRGRVALERGAPLPPELAQLRKLVRIERRERRVRGRGRVGHRARVEAILPTTKPTATEHRPATTSKT